MTYSNNFQVGDWVKVRTPKWGVLAGQIVQITVGKRAHLQIRSDDDGRTYGIAENTVTVLEQKTLPPIRDER